MRLPAVTSARPRRSGRRRRSRSPGSRARNARRWSRCSTGLTSARPASTKRRAWVPSRSSICRTWTPWPAEHRARVEALLPLVDAVAWVTDHEKYADAVLHDEFLRSWLPRLGRQVVLVNKSDRVTDGDARRIQRDLEADLASGVIRGSEVGGPPHERRVARRHRRISSVARRGCRGEARGAGTDRGIARRGRLGSCVGRWGRLGTIGQAAPRWRVARGGGALGDGSRPACDRSARARAPGGRGHPGQRLGPAAPGRSGRLTSLVYRTSGRETAVADPNRFLLRWRERGGLGPAVEAIRDVALRPDPRRAIRQFGPRLRQRWTPAT